MIFSIRILLSMLKSPIKFFFMKHFKKIQENGRMYSFLVLKSNSNIKKIYNKKSKTFCSPDLPLPLREGT